MAAAGGPPRFDYELIGEVEALIAESEPLGASC